MFPLLAEATEPERWAWLWTLLTFSTYITFILALLSIPSVLVRRRGRPQAALTWVLILLTVPVAGLFFWWAIGRSHLRRKRKRRRRTMSATVQRVLKFYEKREPKVTAHWNLVPLERLPDEEREWAYPPTIGNQAHLLIDAAETYPEMEKLVREAESFIHIIFYIWQPDEIGAKFRDLLIEKAKAGVEVRVVLDAFGSPYVARRFMDPLRAAGGEVAIFGPPIFRRWHLEFNFRNHRKLVLVDGKAAVIGGLNIGLEYTTHWHDLAVRLQGPAVDQLQEVFAEDWAFSKGKDFVGAKYFGGWKNVPVDQESCEPTLCAVIASGPESELNLTHEAFLMAISTAKKRIWLTTPYFVPDATILAALRTAVFRGVEVRVMVPEKPDAWIVGLASRSYYRELLRAGVQIYEYCDGVLHAKAAVFDHDIAFVGSANVDVRSFKLNFELSCFMKCEGLCRQLADLFERNTACSKEVKLNDSARVGYWTQVCEAAAHLLSPLL